MKKVNQALAGGFGTSQKSKILSANANGQLDEAYSRLDAIKADQSLSAGAKVAFLKKWRPTVQHTADIQLISLNDEKNRDQARLKELGPKTPELSQHAAMLIASDLQGADAQKRLELLNRDPSYGHIFEEMPAAFFGMEPGDKVKMEAKTRRSRYTVEQRALADEIDAGMEAHRFIGERKADLLKEIDNFIQAHEAASRRMESNSHLYALSEGNAE